MSDLRCTFCGGEFSAVLEYSRGWSEHRDLVGYECDNYKCGAEWDKWGKYVEDSRRYTNAEGLHLNPSLDMQ